MNPHPLIEQLARQQADQAAALIERACEEALQGGKHGVAWDGTRAWVSERVPYGQCYDVSKAPHHLL